MINILYPYEEINIHLNNGSYTSYQFVRKNIMTEGFNNLVWFDTRFYPHPEKWAILSFDLKFYSDRYNPQEMFDTKEHAMSFLDEMLKKHNFILLETKEDIYKYQILM